MLRHTTSIAVLIGVSVALAGCPDMEEPGTPVDVGGFDLVYKKEGDGPYTIVFENGLGDVRTVWNQVQDSLAQTQTTVAYDRGGVGESDRGPDPRTGEVIANELKTMLENSNTPGPYILVGHSFGGVLVRRFIQLFPNDVIGLVLVDPDHEDLERQEVLQMSTESVTQTKNIDVLVADFKGIGSKGELFGEEFVFEALRADPSIPDMPLIVLHAGGHNLHSDDPDHPDQSVWDQIKLNLHQELADLSPIGELRVIPDVGHEIQKQKPEVVITAINDVITELENAKASP